MTWWDVFVGVFFVIAFAVFLIQEGFRTLGIRRLARRFGFQYRGKASLPQALSLYGTPFNRAWFTENQIEGQRGSIHVVAFDCQVGKEVRRAQRTVIAARTTDNVFASLPPGSRLTTAAWTILYEPFDNPSRNTALMPVRELAAILNSIAN